MKSDVVRLLDMECQLKSQKVEQVEKTTTKHSQAEQNQGNQRQGFFWGYLAPTKCIRTWIVCLRDHYALMVAYKQLL